MFFNAQKWKRYVYLERDTTIGNFEAGISKFVFTGRPLQFTHCAEVSFFAALSIKINSNFYFQ
jgi:hypothetical protein